MTELPLSDQLDPIAWPWGDWFEFNVKYSAIVRYIVGYSAEDAFNQTLLVSHSKICHLFIILCVLYFRMQKSVNIVRALCYSLYFYHCSGPAQ